LFGQNSSSVQPRTEVAGDGFMRGDHCGELLAGQQRLDHLLGRWQFMSMSDGAINQPGYDHIAGRPEFATMAAHYGVD
jgi:hypothetical protein